MTVKLLGNPDYALTFGDKGRKLIIDKYDREIVGKRMNEVYQVILG